MYYPFNLRIIMVNIIIFAIAFAVPKTLEVNHSVYLNVSQGFVDAIYANLLNVTSKLFDSSKTKTLNLKSNISQLLEMHNNLTSIAESDFDKMNAAIVLILKLDSDKSEKSLFNLTGPIEKIYQEMHLGLLNSDYSEKKLERIKNLTIKSGEDLVIYNKQDRMIRNQTQAIRPNYAETNKLLRRLKDNSSIEDALNLQSWRSNKNFKAQLANRRVYKSESTCIRYFPFMASIHARSQYACAGAVLSDSLVLTAATCFFEVGFYSDTNDKNQTDFSVRVGSDYSQHQGEEFKVDEIIFYPTFDPDNFTDNLAIARVEKSLPRRMFKIDYGKISDDDKEIFVLGWGDKDNSNDVPLSFAQLPIYDLGVCKKVYSGNFVTDKNFCAGDVNDTVGCKRNAGGPAVVGDKLVGVVSFGAPVSGIPDAPTVFTDLGFYLDWINLIVTENSHLETRRYTNNLRQRIKHKNMSPDDYLAAMDTLNYVLNKKLQHAINRYFHVENEIDSNGISEITTKKSQEMKRDGHGTLKTFSRKKPQPNNGKLKPRDIKQDGQFLLQPIQNHWSYLTKKQQISTTKLFILVPLNSSLQEEYQIDAILGPVAEHKSANKTELNRNLSKTEFKYAGRSSRYARVMHPTRSRKQNLSGKDNVHDSSETTNFFKNLFKPTTKSILDRFTENDDKSDDTLQHDTLNDILKKKRKKNNKTDTRNGKNDIKQSNKANKRIKSTAVTSIFDRFTATEKSEYLEVHANLEELASFQDLGAAKSSSTKKMATRAIMVYIDKEMEELNEYSSDNYEYEDLDPNRQEMHVKRETFPLVVSIESEDETDSDKE